MFGCLCSSHIEVLWWIYGSVNSVIIGSDNGLLSIEYSLPGLNLKQYPRIITHECPSVKFDYLLQNIYIYFAIYTENVVLDHLVSGLMWWQDKIYITQPINIDFFILITPILYAYWCLIFSNWVVNNSIMYTAAVEWNIIYIYIYIYIIQCPRQLAVIAFLLKISHKGTTLLGDVWNALYFDWP